MGLDGEARQPLTAVNANSTIGGSVGRKVLTGFGGTAPTLADGDREVRRQDGMDRGNRRLGRPISLLQPR